MKVSELGEFGLIELLAEIVNSSRGEALLVDIGDDAAAWHTEASIQLATTDAMIQGVHFNLNTTTWRELGWKLLAVNLSDIAAMGGVPRYALVSLGLPGDTEVARVAELYEGMVELARLFGVVIAGGNVAASPLVVLSATVIGAAQTERILTRSAAATGDLIAVTGHLGASAAGLAMLQRGLQIDTESASCLRQAHLKPYPRVAEGQMLARHGVRAAIDLSDGLVSDLAKVCKASGVGARLRVDQVPIHPAVSTAFEEDRLNLALAGGEDYELLFTGEGEAIDRVKELMPCPVTVIGEIVAEEKGKVSLLDARGNELKLEKAGWEHFAKGQ